MANPKEKTPMCLVNELARYNKIQPEYKLLSEQGPAHSKVRLGALLYTQTHKTVSSRLPELSDVVCWSDFLSAVNSGGSALGCRGDQYQKSPALSSNMCSRSNRSPQTQSQKPPPPRQEPRWDLQGLRVYVQFFPLSFLFKKINIPTLSKLNCMKAYFHHKIKKVISQFRFVFSQSCKFISCNFDTSAIARKKLELWEINLQLQEKCQNCEIKTKLPFLFF